MPNLSRYRTVIFFEEYFEVFFVKQNEKVQDKIIWTIELIETTQRVPKTFLKHITGTDGLYEIRVKWSSDVFRIFCFFDKGNLVVLANGFQKKSQKLPRKEIAQAVKIKQAYENRQ